MSGIVSRKVGRGWCRNICLIVLKNLFNVSLGAVVQFHWCWRGYCRRGRGLRGRLSQHSGLCGWRWSGRFSDSGETVCRSKVLRRHWFGQQKVAVHFLVIKGTILTENKVILIPSRGDNIFQVILLHDTAVGGVFVRRNHSVIVLKSKAPGEDIFVDRDRFMLSQIVSQDQIWIVTQLVRALRRDGKNYTPNQNQPCQIGRAHV